MCLTTLQLPTLQVVSGRLRAERENSWQIAREVILLNNYGIMRIRMLFPGDDARPAAAAACLSWSSSDGIRLSSEMRTGSPAWGSNCTF